MFFLTKIVDENKMNMAFYADGIIERFDLENLEALSELEVNILWHEISVGLKFLNFQKFDRTELARLSGMKPNNFRNFGKLFNLVSINNNQQKPENTENPSKKRRHFYDDINCPKAKVHRKSTEEVNVTHENSREEWECQFCSKTYRNARQMIWHQRQSHFQYKCPICSETKSGLTNTRIHIKNIHSHPNPNELLPENTEIEDISDTKGQSLKDFDVV